MTMEVITVRNGEIIRGKLFGDHMEAYRFCVQRNWRTRGNAGRQCQLAIQITGGERNEKKGNH